MPQGKGTYGHQVGRPKATAKMPAKVPMKMMMGGSKEHMMPNMPGKEMKQMMKKHK